MSRKGRCGEFRWRRDNSHRTRRAPRVCLSWSKTQDASHSRLGGLVRSYIISKPTPTLVVISVGGAGGLVTAAERRRFVQRELSDKRVRQMLRVADELWAGVAKGDYECARSKALT